MELHTNRARASCPFVIYRKVTHVDNVVSETLGNSNSQGFVGIYYRFAFGRT